MAQDSQNTGSLYDFLYLDKERIKSIIAQLNDNGVLQTLKQVNGEKNTDTSGLNIGGGAGALLFKAEGKANKSLTDECSESFELTHDATWSLPLQLLDLLHAHNLITFGTSDSRLGSLSLISGNIVIFDVSTMKKSLPFFANYFALQRENALSNIPPKARPSKKKPKTIDDIEVSDGVTVGIIKDLLDVIPTQIQVDFYEVGGSRSWMSLNPEWLTINPTDLALKYGSRLPGQWNVLGIVDAMPDYLMDTTFEPFILDEDNDMKSGVCGMIDQLRTMFGRSDTKYGITPLLIFRKIES
ncbi:TPA: hypothetical protein R4229_001733 [Morganella morganii]|nr:hypothetical protein [Morganella morganii]